MTNVLFPLKTEINIYFQFRIFVGWQLQLETENVHNLKQSHQLLFYLNFIPKRYYLIQIKKIV